MSSLDKLTSITGETTRLAEQTMATAASGPDAMANGSSIAGPAQNTASALFPELSQVFGGVFKAIQPSPQVMPQMSPQTAPLPFSPASSNNSSALLNNPSQLQRLLGSASQKLLAGLGNTNLDSISSIGSLEQAADQASQQAAETGNPQDQLVAQQALIQLQVAVDQASTIMHIQGQEMKEAIDNSASDS